MLHNYCSTPELLNALGPVLEVAPLRRMYTPGGRKMSVAITNCGKVGWVSDSTGYSYTSHDPLTTKAWPVMPDLLFELAKNAASRAGFLEFEPDCCLINVMRQMQVWVPIRTGMNKVLPIQLFLSQWACPRYLIFMVHSEGGVPLKFVWTMVTFWFLVVLPGWHFTAWASVFQRGLIFCRTIG